APVRWTPRATAHRHNSMRWRAARALTKHSGRMAPPLALPPRAALPPMAIMSPPLTSCKALTQANRHRWKATGSKAANTRPNVSGDGMPGRRSKNLASQPRRRPAKRAISSHESAPAMTPHTAMTTMFNNGWAMRLRRRRGSGKPAKNRLMETEVSEEEPAMQWLREPGDLHGHPSPTPCLFQSLRGKLDEV